MKITRSLLFRLGLIYAGLFLTSVVVLLALFYWVTILQPLERAREGITAEVQQMRGIFDAEGTGQLASVLQRRGIDASPPRGFHALIDPQGRTITANLPSWPRQSGENWLQIEADFYLDGDEEDHEALVFDLELPDGSRLLLGRDIEDIDDIREALWQASLWGIPSLVLLVLVGSAIMSMAVTRRLDAISRAARRVMNGSLGDRIPLAHTGDDLDRLAGTLNEMLARIEASMLSVRRVSDSVAHELRTPLARMHATLVGMKNLEEEDPSELLGKAIGEVELMTRMFDAVLRISRIESGRHSVEKVPVDIGSVIADVVDFYEPVIEQNSIALSVETSPGLMVAGDRDLIFQALANVLDNAVKFTPRNGAIALRGARTDQGTVLTVSDNGPGIPADIRSFVTERFYRGPAYGTSGGFGLGLALVEAVAKLHGSTLEFLSAEPGLTVKWTFAATEASRSV